MTDVNVTLAEEVNDGLSAFSEFTVHALQRNLKSLISSSRTTKLSDPFADVVDRLFHTMNLVRHSTYSQSEAICFWDDDVLVLVARGTEYDASGLDEGDDADTED